MGLRAMPHTTAELLLPARSPTDHRDKATRPERNSLTAIATLEKTTLWDDLISD
jgi:hypothetical protein